MMRTEDTFWKGYQPKVTQETGNSEVFKYGKMWDIPAYRVVSPGEDLIPLFLMHANPPKNSQIIDFGCGTGRASLTLHGLGYKVLMIDFARNCLDDQVKEVIGDKFIKADLEKKSPVVSEYGLCCDVMEHIPPDKLDTVLANILMASRNVFFSISTKEDNAGELIGEDLHLSVHPYSWWYEKFKANDVTIHWSKECSNASLFYVSAWQNGQAVVDSGELNESDDNIIENVKANTKGEWIQVTPCFTSDAECLILGGGPSLPNHLEEIKQRRAEGAKIITLNGTYNWAIENGLTPSAQIMVDARPFNSRFVKPVVDLCKYLISSQCHPSVFEGLPPDRTYIWHTGCELISDVLQENYGVYWPVSGGSTVLLRAIPLMRMLGYSKFHLYGCDSCLVGDSHHAYEQKENDGAVILPVSLGGKIFQCMPWMAAQATEFISLIQSLGDEIELEVYGEGLLAWILEHAAQLADEEDSKQLSLQIV